MPQGSELVELDIEVVHRVHSLYTPTAAHIAVDMAGWTCYPDRYPRGSVVEGSTAVPEVADPRV